MFFFHQFGVFPKPKSTLSLLSPHLHTLHLCTTTKKASDEAVAVVNALEKVLGDKEDKWETTHMSRIVQSIIHFLTISYESSSFASLVFFAHVYYLHNSYLSDLSNYPILKGGWFIGRPSERNGAERYNNITLQKDGSEPAIITHLNDTSLHNCTLSAFLERICQPMSDARGGKRSLNLEAITLSDNHLLFQLPISVEQGDTNDARENEENTENNKPSEANATKTQSEVKVDDAHDANFKPAAKAELFQQEKPGNKY